MMFRQQRLFAVTQAVLLIALLAGVVAKESLVIYAVMVGWGLLAVATGLTLLWGHESWDCPNLGINGTGAWPCENCECSCVRGICWHMLEPRVES